MRLVGVKIATSLREKHLSDLGLALCAESENSDLPGCTLLCSEWVPVLHTQCLVICKLGKSVSFSRNYSY